MKYWLLLFIFFYPFYSFTQDISSGRISYYPFNGNAVDEAGANDGIVSGASLISDRFGNSNSAYKFDGLDDFIKIPNHPSINFSANDDFTISVWVSISDNQQDLRGSNNEILGKWNTSTSVGYPYAIRYWNSNAPDHNKKRVFSLKYDTQFCGHNPIINGICEISTDVWHHLVFTKSGSKIKLYQNGILQGTETDNTSLTCDTENDFPVYLGKRDGNQRYFTGLIDDLSFYNRALDIDEIALLLNDGGWQVSESIQDTDILSFSVPGQIEPSRIDFLNNTVDLYVACGTSITNLTPSFELSEGASAVVNGLNQISGVTEHNFSQPILYTVTNENCSQEDWLINVHPKDLNQNQINSKTAFTHFEIPNQIGRSIINTELHTIEVTMPCYSNLAGLVPAFVLPQGSKAKVSGETQESGMSAIDFTVDVVYQVFHQDKCAIQDWVVKVNLENLNNEVKEKTTTFLSFSIPEQTGPTKVDFNNKIIEIEVACSSDIRNLNPIFSLPDGSIASISGNVQDFNNSSVDFSSPVIYKIQNEQSCSNQEWIVTVSKKAFSKEFIDWKSKEYFIPNVITPNGDKTNETFVIGSFFLGSELSIFNRFGRLVYHNSNYSNDFNGINLSTGTYYFIIRNVCLKDPIKGPLVLIKQ